MILAVENQQPFDHYRWSSLDWLGQFDFSINFESITFNISMKNNMDLTSCFRVYIYNYLIFIFKKKMLVMFIILNTNQTPIEVSSGDEG